MSLAELLTSELLQTYGSGQTGLYPQLFARFIDAENQLAEFRSGMVVDPLLTDPAELDATIRAKRAEYYALAIMDFLRNTAPSVASAQASAIMTYLQAHNVGNYTGGLVWIGQTGPVPVVAQETPNVVIPYD